MQLTLHTDYALRMLLYLAMREDKGGTIAEVAQYYKISRNHLVKIAHQLGKLGLIHTTRGRTGGLHLARPAGDIGIGDVVRQMEPNLHLVECFNPERNTCVIAPACALRGALFEARRAFLTTLDNYTLADLTRNRQELLGLLEAGHVLKSAGIS